MKEIIKEKGFNLERFIEENGLNKHTIGDEYEMYKTYYSNLDYELFCILDRNGMLGRYWRGLRIDLIKENIHIKCDWVRNEIFKMTNQQVPCITKEELIKYI
jgi:hypothetical protein